MDQDQPSTADEDLLRDKIIGRLRTIYDPEIPVNLFDLGLIYRIELSPKDDKYDLHIDMTLTSVGCPLADQMPGMVSRSVEDLEEVSSVDVALVWEPPWDKSMMSDEARFELGWF